MNNRSFALCVVFIALVLAAFHRAVPAQTGDLYDKKSDASQNRKYGLNVLTQIRQLLREEYFDSNYKGIDLDARFKAAEEQIRSQDMRWQMNRTIAQFLLDMNDSHTRFYPLDRLYQVEYGFRTMVIGNLCFVTVVKKGSDAENQGLTPGDRIDDFNGIVPERGNHWAINYLIYTLDPQETLRLKVTDPQNRSKEMTIKSTFLSPEEVAEEGKRRRKLDEDKPFTCREVSSDVLACKFQSFRVSNDSVDKMMKTVAPYKKLILDLRGNGGGYVDTEIHMTGHFFNRKVKIGTEVARKGRKERIATNRDNPFLGELFVLIDSNSASASEVFARTIQLEKRGVIIGDTSRGAVMTSRKVTLAIGGGTAAMNPRLGTWFGVSVTIGDLLMSDGVSLEGVGVTPEHRVGPTATALRQRNDPVLAFAAELAGTPITPEMAGSFNFLVPKTEEEGDNEDPAD